MTVLDARAFLTELYQPSDRWAKKAAALLSTIADAEWRAELREEFEERAGIAEFHGELNRIAAERVAFECLAQRLVAKRT